MVDGALAINSGQDAIAQDILTRLSMFQGEWRQNINEGTPWFQDIFVQPFDSVTAEFAIKERILTTIGVQRLNAFTVDFNTVQRKVTVSFNVSTVYGDVELEGVEVP